jgi:hypothetical protein
MMLVLCGFAAMRTVSPDVAAATPVIMKRWSREQGRVPAGEGAHCGILQRTFRVPARRFAPRND